LTQGISWWQLFFQNNQEQNLEFSKFEYFLALRGYSTVFEILDRGSEENETSYRNSEKLKMKIFPFAPDQK
jgi:hypothetical protein